MRPYHITINGVPFCDWNGCIAHMDIAKRAGVMSCDYNHPMAAVAAMDALTRAGVTGSLAAVKGNCPNN